jgi:hypothetical protein
VPRKYEEDPQLGTWVSNQRLNFKNNGTRMDPERKRMLDEIDFEFSVQDNTNEEKWNLQFKKLQDYYEKHGHCELFWVVDCFPLS